MRLLHVVTFRLTLMATALLTFWSVLFYIAMMDEVNDEVDDSLEDYAEMIILRSLRGEALPRSANGTNNFYFLVTIPSTPYFIKPSLFRTLQFKTTKSSKNV